MKTAKCLFLFAMYVWTLANAVAADSIMNQPPVAGGGIVRWSQLWQDPGPNGNDLDGDSVCFADFTLTWPAAINHLEWWGSGACELGFQIEFWKQDPGTVAYQPLGVFYYGGDHTIRPESRFQVAPGDYSETSEGSLTHFVLDLPTSVQLQATNASNPRWFICVIGLTQRAYYTFNWAQGVAAIPQTFQFIRGGTSGSGPLFRRLGDARAIVASGQVDSPPQIRISLVAPQTVEIGWDAQKTGYSLLSAPQLNPANWTATTNAVSVINGECVVQLEIGSSRYFQLAK